MEEKIKSGSFEGPYLDANGYRGTLKLSLAVDDVKISGNCHLTLRDTDDPLIYSGSVEGDFKAESLTLKLNLNDPSPKDDSFLSLETNLVVSDASSFAVQAIYGIISASPGSGLGGGVWIGWIFKG